MILARFILQLKCVSLPPTPRIPIKPRSHTFERPKVAMAIILAISAGEVRLAFFAIDLLAPTSYQNSLL
jgi:hypothetical protein